MGMLLVGKVVVVVAGVCSHCYCRLGSSMVESGVSNDYDFFITNKLYCMQSEERGEKQRDRVMVYKLNRKQVSPFPFPIWSR